MTVTGPAEPVHETRVTVVPDTGAILPQDHYTYSVPPGITPSPVPGARVEVPFGRRTVVG